MQRLGTSSSESQHPLPRQFILGCPISEPPLGLLSHLKPFGQDL